MGPGTRPWPSLGGLGGLPRKLVCSADPSRARGRVESQGGVKIKGRRGRRGHGRAEPEPASPDGRGQFRELAARRVEKPSETTCFPKQRQRLRSACAEGRSTCRLAWRCHASRAWAAFLDVPSRAAAGTIDKESALRLQMQLLLPHRQWGGDESPRAGAMPSSSPSRRSWMMASCVLQFVSRRVSWGGGLTHLPSQARPSA